MNTDLAYRHHRPPRFILVCVRYEVQRRPAMDSRIAAIGEFIFPVHERRAPLQRASDLTSTRRIHINSGTRIFSGHHENKGLLSQKVVTRQARKEEDDSIKEREEDDQTLRQPYQRIFLPLSTLGSYEPNCKGVFRFCLLAEQSPEDSLDSLEQNPRDPGNQPNRSIA